jgi:Helix-turn-helix.
MGRYRLGDIIRMTRKSLSITQEQLSEDICSVETLSRIETGKQNPSRDVYELLMERMGRIRERAYSILSVSDFKVLEKMQAFEEAIQSYDFQRAEKILKEILKKQGDTNLDKQFKIRAVSLVNYRLGRISTDEFLDELQKAIRLTIPKYGNISLKNWPLTYNEANIILNISTAYAEKNEYQKAVEILEEAYGALNQSYMDVELRNTFQVFILNNLSKWYGLMGNHQKAIDVTLQGIKICKECKIGNVLPNLLYNYAWNKRRLIDEGVLSQEYKRECIRAIKQAYYISCAMQYPYGEQFLKQHLSKYYNINVI